MKVQSYKDLDVWKKGVEVVDLVYKMTDSFPRSERYGLAVQMQRAAVSIPSNVAEGFARRSTKEYRQFLHMSLGSCAELETQMFIARRRNYVSSAESSQAEEYLDHESRMLRNLIRSLRDE